MEEIKYNERGLICTTLCPYKQKAESNQIKRVGSHACNRCRYYNNTDKNKCTIHCTYKDQYKQVKKKKKTFNEKLIVLSRLAQEKYEKENKIKDTSNIDYGTDKINNLVKKFLPTASTIINNCLQNEKRKLNNLTDIKLYCGQLANNDKLKSIGIITHLTPKGVNFLTIEGKMTNIPFYDIINQIKEGSISFATLTDDIIKYRFNLGLLKKYFNYLTLN